MLERCIGEGNTAQIFQWGEDQVLKLFRKGLDQHTIAKEHAISKKVVELGLPVPKVGNLVDINDRTGIVYEKIYGISMMDTIIKKPWKIGKKAELLAQIHYQIHKVKLRNEIEAQKDAIKRNIKHTELLDEDKKVEILHMLENLPDGEVLCHGDFHPGNCIVNGENTYILDWMTAVRGNACADVARTLLLLTKATIPTNIPKFLAFVINLSRSRLANIYLKHYIKISGVNKAEIMEWRIPIAAARLVEWIPESEKQVLLSIINNQ